MAGRGERERRPDDRAGDGVDHLLRRSGEVAVLSVVPPTTPINSSGSASKTKGALRRLLLRLRHQTKLTR